MRWISIGTEADLTPDQARAEDERIRGLKRQGIDPATDRVTGSVSLGRDEPGNLSAAPSLAAGDGAVWSLPTTGACSVSTRSL